MLAALHKAKVDTTSVLKTKDAPSGIAMIVVDRHGENAIIVASGANRQLSATDLLAERKTIETSVVLTAQLEVPHDTVACAFALARRSNVLTILDPAPAPPEGLPESDCGPKTSPGRAEGLAEPDCGPKTPTASAGQPPPGRQPPRAPA